MASIFDWSVVAADNDDADTDINWMEGQFPDTVNNSARAMMMRIAQWIKDQGVLTAAGTANAITLVTTNNTITVPPAGMTVSFKAAATNTGAVTLAINGGGSKPVRKLNAGDSDAVALTASDIQAKGVYLVHFDSGANAGAGAWILINPTNQSKFTDISNTYVKKSGDTMTGTLTVPGLISSGGISGSLQHQNDGGYLNIGSYSTSTYGSGNARVWWNENDHILTVGALNAGRVTVSCDFVLLSSAAPTDNFHAVRLVDLNNGLSGKFNNPSGSTAQYIRGNGSLATLNSTAVGLGNVNNTSDLSKPMSTATKTYVDGQIENCVTNVRL